jgi:hypothetical protein
MKCKCGHLGELHCALPGHPDNAVECYGSDNCDCWQFEPVSGLDRVRVQLARATEGEFAVREITGVKRKENR